MRLSSVAYAATVLLLSFLSSVSAMDFKALTCNDLLSVDDCSPDSLNYHGNLADLLASGDTQIPCGKCATVETTDGSELDGTATGINVEGMLYFPSTANLTLQTTHIIVQGILKMDPPSVALGNKVTIRLVGSENRFLFPHSENAMACDSSTGCDIGKKAIVVAGGRLDIRGLEDPTCPGWTKLQSLEPPSGVSENTGCPLDYDATDIEDGTFESYDVGTTKPSGIATHRTNENGYEVLEESGNKFLHLRSAGRWYSSSGIGIILNAQCLETASTSNNGGRYSFNIRYRVTGSGWTSTPFMQMWGVGRNIGQSCPTPIIDEWVTCNVFITLTDDESESNGLNLVLTMNVEKTLNIDFDDIKFEAIPRSHEITLADPKAAECWSPNDELLVTYTQSWTSQVVRDIKYVDNNTGKISFAHTDSLYSSNSLPNTIENLSGSSQIMAAEVAWLSRAIVFEAEGDGGSGTGIENLHGGHLKILCTPNVAQYIEGVEIRDFGQQGILGTYPIHFHMSGDVDGSIVRKNVIRNSKQRCVVIHGSHNVTIEENVAFDTYGHCYMLEDGGERGNTFLNNLGARTRAQQVSIGSTDHIPSALWITNPDNHFIGNVAAGSSHNGIWFELRAIRADSAELPENEGVNPQGLPLGTFKDNSAHNCDFRAITPYDIGYRPYESTLFEGTSVWNSNIGFFMHGSQNLVLKDSFFAYNSLSILSFGNFGWNSVEDSTFIGDCETGIQSLKTSFSRTNTLRVSSSSFDFPSSCGRAITIDREDEHSHYEMPILSNLTSVNGNYLLHMTSTFPDMNFFIEDHDGSLHPSGPGFFVNDRVATLIDSELCTAQPRHYGYFCENICLRRVMIDTNANLQIVVTSLTNLTKSYVFDEAASWGSTFRFDLVLPFDEYSVHFLETSSGNIMIPPVTITFDEGVDPPICGQHITSETLIVECPEGYSQRKDYLCVPSSPTISPAPSYPEYAVHVACGASHGSCSSDVQEKSTVEDTLNVRCCSDSEKSGWTKKSFCDVWSASVINGMCGEDMTFSDASLHCAGTDDVAGRLCTLEEILGDCTTGTGCNFDHDFVWTSTIVDSSPEDKKVAAVCGAITGKCTYQEQEASMEDLHEVRCCSDSIMDGWEKKDHCSVWSKSKIGNGDRCISSTTFDSARAICGSQGGRLCTREEVAGGCAAATGCGFDAELVWTSTDV